MQYLYNFKVPNGILLRWILALQEYHFKVKYRSGDQNTFEDALSRLPVEEEINCLQLIDPVLNFDKNISDICVLKQTPTEEILQKLQSEQHADECSPQHFGVVFPSYIFQKGMSFFLGTSSLYLTLTLI